LIPGYFLDFEVYEVDPIGSAWKFIQKTYRSGVDFWITPNASSIIQFKKNERSSGWVYERSSG
jgi:hypothetical protein